MTPPTPDDLRIIDFATVDDLRDWLTNASTTHPGVWVRLPHARSSRPSVTFHELLVEGIGHG